MTFRLQVNWLVTALPVGQDQGMTLRLRPPTTEDEVPLRRMHDQLAQEGFSFLLAEGPWAEVLGRIERESRGVLEDVRPVPSGPGKRRYWIDASAAR